MYQIKTDNLLGLKISTVGLIASEKIKEFYFSCVGNVFSTVEAEGASRNSLNFYMISRISNEGQTTHAEQQLHKKGARLVTEKHIAAVDDTFEFRKIARHEVNDRQFVGQWDENGRYFAIAGRKSSQLDKTAKSIRFYNMFGELLMMYNDIYSLDQLRFRPRPTDSLNENQMKKLKKEYKKKYEQLFKNEETTEKKVASDIVKDQRKKIRDDFLDNFYLPLRRQYETDIEKYKNLFPIKESDMEKEPATTKDIYAFKEVISQRKVDF